MIQMQQGVAGTLSDFHPPMMGFVWGLFGRVFGGPGPMFIFHLMLYWSATTLFAMAEPHKAKWVYLIALLPPVFAYQLLVLKDISFVNAYLFCAAWLHFYSMREDLSPSWLSLLTWLFVAFYGTCATYQGALALPWLCLWLAKFYSSDKSKNWIFAGLILFCVIILGVVGFNKTMATHSNRGEHHKLYDLAGISIQLNEPVFPDYVKQAPNYNFEKIKKLYNFDRLDDLIYTNNSPLSVTENPDNLDALDSFWLKAIFNYPTSYLKHRFGVFKSQLTVSLLKHPSDIKGESTPLITKVITWIEKLGIFTIAKWLMAYALYFLWQLIYIYKGYRNFNKNPKYVSLFFQNIMGVSLVLSLFFIAGAAEARYAYIAIAMLFFSHPFLFKTANSTQFISRRFA